MQTIRKYIILVEDLENELELYHGGDEPIDILDRRGPYRSVFASAEKNAAYSHGDIVTKFHVDSKKIADGWLDIEHGYEQTKRALESAMKESGYNYPDSFNFEDIYDIVVYGESDKLKDFYDDVDLMIELQALRADVAHKLGYHAVTTRDEHGTSYQILKANKISTSKQ